MQFSGSLCLRSDSCPFFCHDSLSHCELRSFLMALNVDLAVLVYVGTAVISAARGKKEHEKNKDGDSA